MTGGQYWPLYPHPYCCQAPGYILRRSGSARVGTRVGALPSGRWGSSCSTWSAVTFPSRVTSRSAVQNSDLDTESRSRAKI